MEAGDDQYHIVLDEEEQPVRKGAQPCSPDGAKDRWKVERIARETLHGRIEGSLEAIF